MSKSGYAMAHGDTEAVRLVVMNYEHTYCEVVRITTRVAWWDDSDDTWNDIDKAVREYRALVESLDPNADGFTDLQGIDLDQVDFVQLVRDELYEINLQDGREGNAGL